MSRALFQGFHGHATDIFFPRKMSRELFRCLGNFFPKCDGLPKNATEKNTPSRWGYLRALGINELRKTGYPAAPGTPVEGRSPRNSSSPRSRRRREGYPRNPSDPEYPATPGAPRTTPSPFKHPGLSRAPAFWNRGSWRKLLVTQKFQETTPHFYFQNRSPRIP